MRVLRAMPRISAARRLFQPVNWRVARMWRRSTASRGSGCSVGVAGASDDASAGRSSPGKAQVDHHRREFVVGEFVRRLGRIRGSHHGKSAVLKRVLELPSAGGVLGNHQD
jgi:hypothetical protein